MHKGIETFKRALIEVMAPSGDPFFAAILLQHDIVTDSNIPTACTDGKTLRYNPDWFASLSRKKAMSIVLHEASHVAYGHPWRVPKCDATEHHLWNVAGDLAINHLIPWENKDEGCHAGLREFQAFPVGKCMEEYKKLLDKLPPDKQPSGGGNGKDGQLEGEFARAAKADDPLGKQEYERIIVQAVQSAKQQAGKLPAGIEEIYTDILAKPKTNWKVLLRNLVSAIARNRYTYERPNKRYAAIPQFIMPVRRGHTLDKVAFIFDTSGSMHGVVQKVVSEMEALAMQFDDCCIEMIMCDAAVQGHKTYHKSDFPMNLNKIKWRGFGGTDMRPAFDLAKKLSPAAIICLTDGAMSWPEHPGKPVVWVLTTDTTPPYGMVSYISEGDK